MLFQNKRLMLFFLGLIYFNIMPAQQKETDSLKLILKKHTALPNFEVDTNYIKTLNELAFKYQNSNPDTTIFIANQVIATCNRINYSNGKVEALKNTGLAYLVKGKYDEAWTIFEDALKLAEETGYIVGAGKIYQNLGIVYHNLGKYPEALESYFKALKMREKTGDKSGISSSLTGIGAVYFVQGKYTDALNQYLKALKIALEINFKPSIQNAYANIGEVYFRQGDLVKAEENLMLSLNLDKFTGNKEVKAFISTMMASIYFKQGKLEAASTAYNKTNELAAELGSREHACRSNLGLGEVYLAMNKTDLALQYTLNGIAIANQIRFAELQRDGNEILSKIYEATGKGMLSLQHHKLFKLFADSINNQQTEKRAGNLAAEYEYSKKEIALKANQEKEISEFNRRTAQQRWVIFSAFAALLSSLVVVWLVYKSKQKEKKANELLQLQNEEIAKQKSDLEKTIKELHDTQSQLIQSEKMASLGELTAGIAHEIQNPLNFVTNFSELNNELIEEMNDELNKGAIDEAKLIATDIKENSLKINHHGKRADAIVKGMLQHSRSSNGVKEPTDINALADEYLRLAYHGLRAKDKTFNASMITDYDDSIGDINIIPQDIGRVILNLITNAFYAVTEKKRQNVVSYEPTVTVSTQKIDNKIEIRVSDNGNGIPENIMEKIFQPFFTTKPTGQGTGLGLSLSYDILKGHGGELKAETRPGVGSTFIILLNNE